MIKNILTIAVITIIYGKMYQILGFELTVVAMMVNMLYCLNLIATK